MVEEDGKEFGCYDWRVVSGKWQQTLVVAEELDLLW